MSSIAPPLRNDVAAVVLSTLQYSSSAHSFLPHFLFLLLPLPFSFQGLEREGGSGGKEVDRDGNPPQSIP